MVIGTYTLARLPGYMTIVRPELVNSDVMTYTNVAYFSWGASIVGKKIQLKWAAMPPDQFDSLDAIYVADASVVWDPTDVAGGSTTYNVRMISFDAEYIPGAVGYRGNTTMVLLILSEVTV